MNYLVKIITENKVFIFCEIRCFLEFDGGISLVIAVKMPRSHENHVQNHWVIARYAVRARTMFCTILEP